MKGVELAARFSFIVNQLRFCGPEGASKTIREYFRGGSGDLRSLLSRFEGAYAYLESIGRKSKRDPFDESVVEAYWIGNELLDCFTDDDVRMIIERLIQRGLPESIGKNRIDNLPSGLFPHHNFNVFYVGVGNLTGSVETTLNNMENCRINSGTVLEVLTSDSMLVKTTSLIVRDGRVYDGKEDILTVTYLPEILPGIKTGDCVALHWGFAPMILNDTQKENLREYTDKLLLALGYRLPIERKRA